jgi:hypothetical protein
MVFTARAVVLAVAESDRLLLIQNQGKILSSEASVIQL